MSKIRLFKLLMHRLQACSCSCFAGAQAVGNGTMIVELVMLSTKMLVIIDKLFFAIVNSTAGVPNSNPIANSRVYFD